MTYLFWFSLTLSMFLILFILWMKWKMRVSKGRFALATISSFVTCLFVGLSAMSTSIPLIAVSKISVLLGFGEVTTSAPNSFALFLTVAVIFAIYRFSSKAIVNWDAPLTVSEAELAERFLDNSMYALAATQIRLLATKQVDPIASEVATNWKAEVAQPPKSLEAKDLLRDLLTASVREVQIPDDGWRDNGKLWVGEILGLQHNDTKKLLVLVFGETPCEQEISNRIDELDTQISRFTKVKIIAVYFSEDHVKDTSGTYQVNGYDVEILSSRKMIFMGLDLNGYARELLKNFRNQKIGGTTATLENSFVELRIDRPDSGWPPLNLTSKLSSWREENSDAHLAITGEYGQGKSTALLKFCCDWAERFLKEGSIEEPIPLLIELRGKSPSETDPLSFLSTWCSRYQLLPQQVLNLIKSGDAIVIFEGFDELKNAGRAFDRHQHFNALWRFAYPGTKLIFTGRPNFFLDQAEANRTLRNEGSRAASGGSYTEVWRLQKLKPRQIRDACRNYKPNVSAGIASSIEENYDFLDIVSRPSMLPVVATIWEDIERLQQSGTPLTGAVLIERYIQAVFIRKEIELEKDMVQYDAPIGSRYLIFPKPVRELLTICVAWRMSGLRDQNTISRSEIYNMIKDIYDTLFVVARSRDVTPEVSMALLEFEKRFSDHSPSERVDAITTEICNSGLLIPDPAGGPSNLQFPHKQFFEFLIAKATCIYKLSNSGASVILASSSPEKSIVKRLYSEPNSIQYLTECNGPTLSVLHSGFFDRLLTQIALVQTLFFHRASLAMKKIRTIIFRRKQEEDVDALGTKSMLENDEMINIMYRYSHYSTRWINLLAAALALTTSILSLIPNFKDLFEGQLVNSESPIHLSYGAFLTLPMVLTFVLLITTSSKLFLDIDRVSVLMRFLLIHWAKAGKMPLSDEEKMLFATKSLIRDKVQFTNSASEINGDFQQFLYPAEYFGSQQDTQ